MKESGQYQSWGKLAAASGLVGITFNHRYHAPGMLEQSAQVVVAAIGYFRTHANTFNLNPNRLCLWTCSGGGSQICFALREQPVYIRCMVLYYTLLDLRPIPRHVDALGETVAHQYSPVVCLQDKPLGFPVFLARAGLDNQTLNQTMDSFIIQALQANANLEVMTHSQGHHGFDIVDDNPRSRQIIARTLAFIRENV
jgi:acetyl esterase/lipase